MLSFNRFYHKIESFQRRFSRDALRIAMKRVYTVLHALRVGIASDKTEIGKARHGFKFLGKRILPIGIHASTVALSRVQKNAVRLYEQGASKRRICQFGIRWLAWATAFLLGMPSAHALYCPPSPVEGEAGAGEFPYVSASVEALAPFCYHGWMVDSPEIAPFANDDGFYYSNTTAVFPFILLLPDGAPSGAVHPARAYSFDAVATSSSPPFVTCAGATITSLTYSTTIMLSDGSSCALTIISPNSKTTYTATLSRTGPVYSVSAGTVCGGAIGECPQSVILSISANSGSEAAVTAITVTATASAAVSGDQTVIVDVLGTGFVTGITAGDYTLSNTTLTIPNGATTGTVTFTIVDDALIEGTETATISLFWPSSGIELGSTTTQNVTITDNEVAGFTLSKTIASVNESGTTDTFTVVLDSQPTSNVEISVTSGSTSEATVSPATLTFTPANWNTAQTMTVTGVDESVSDGNKNTTVTLSVVTANSDNAFTALANQTVTVTTVDNDVPGFSSAQIGGNINASESGINGDYTIALSSQPTGDIQLTVTADTQTQVSNDSTTFGNTAVLTFTNGNWNTAQTVTVKAIDDTAIEGNHTGTITHAITGTVVDTNYPTTLTLGNVKVNIADNDQQINDNNTNNSGNSGSGSTPLVATMNLKVDFRGDGSAQITTDPAGLVLHFEDTSGAEATADYPKDSVVKLIIETQAGTEFIGFEGDPDCNDASVTMDASKHCLAHFKMDKPVEPPVTPPTTKPEPPVVIAPPPQSEPQSERGPISDLPPVAEGPCPTDRHYNIHLDEACNAEGKTLEKDLRIVFGGHLSNATVISNILCTDQRGWLGSNITIAETARVEDCVVTGKITNNGLMQNIEFRGQSITGGTLAGIIIIGSQVKNQICDVILAPGTAIQGKVGNEFAVAKLCGKITGDPTNPAKLENVTITAGTQLDNVIIGKGVILEEGVILGENVTFADGSQKPEEPTVCEPNALGLDKNGKKINGLKDCFTIQLGKEHVEVAIQIDPAHIDQKADLLLVIKVSPTEWYSLDQNKWKSWNGNLDSLKAKETFKALPETIVLDLANTEFSALGNQLTLFVGYQLQDGTIVYNPGESL